MKERIMLRTAAFWRQSITKYIIWGLSGAVSIQKCNVDLNYSSHKALGRTIPNEPGPKGTDLASVRVLGTHRPHVVCVYMNIK